MLVNTDFMVNRFTALKGHNHDCRGSRLIHVLYTYVFRE